MYVHKWIYSSSDLDVYIAVQSWTEYALEML